MTEPQFGIGRNYLARIAPQFLRLGRAQSRAQGGYELLMGVVSAHPLTAPAVKPLTI